jgi:nucleoid-associated protein YgaU
MPALRLDQIAQERYGEPSLWRWVASVNDIDNPLELPEGTVLRLAAHRVGGVR